jgi:hypothetical protein
VNWQAIGAVGEILGALAVVATLGYLAVQIRESRKATAADVYQTRAAHRADQQMRLALNCPNYHEIHARFIADTNARGPTAALAALDEHERFLVTQYFSATMILMDNACFQYERGFVSDAYFTTTATWGMRLSGPIWRAIGVRPPPHLEKALRSVLDEDAV